MSVEIKVPALGESIVEATVGQWLKHEGERVSAGEPVVELETEKVNMEVVAPADGVLRAISKREGDTVAIGEVLAELAEGEAPSPAPGEAASVGETVAPAPGSAVPVPAPQPPPAPAGQLARLDETSDTRVSPLARRIASERGVDLSRVHGSGVGGRITQDDVTGYLVQQNNGGGTAPATAPVAAPAPPTPSGPAPAFSPPSHPARPQGAGNAHTAAPPPPPPPPPPGPTRL